MKEMLGRYADGQVEMLQRAMEEWDRVSRVHMLASEAPADSPVDQRARPQRRQTRLALGASLSGCMLTADHPPSPAHPGGRVVGASDEGRGHAPSPSHRREEQRRFCHNCRFGAAEVRRLTAGGSAPQSGMHVVAVPAWRGPATCEADDGDWGVCEAGDGPGHAAALLTALASERVGRRKRRHG
jgi:hypothetical protein